MKNASFVRRTPWIAMTLLTTAVVACSMSSTSSGEAPRDGGNGLPLGPSETTDPSEPAPGAATPDASTVDASIGDAAAVDASIGDAAATIPCDPSQPFAAVMAVPGLAPVGGPSPIENVRLTPDELRAVYTRLNVGPAGGANLYEVSRTSRALPFSSERKMTELKQGGSGGVDNGSISPDGLTIYFQADPADGGTRQIFVAQRAAISSPFGPRAAVAALASAPSDAAPYLVGDELWFSRLGAAEWDIFHVALNGSPPGSPVVVTDLNDAAQSSVAPVVSEDGLTAFFARYGSANAVTTAPVMMEAHRASLQTPFTVREMTELNTNWETPSWISPDGCRLYFTHEAQSAAEKTAIRIAIRMP